MTLFGPRLIPDHISLLNRGHSLNNSDNVFILSEYKTQQLMFIKVRYQILPNVQYKCKSQLSALSPYLPSSVLLQCLLLMRAPTAVKI